MNNKHYIVLVVWINIKLCNLWNRNIFFLLLEKVIFWGVLPHSPSTLFHLFVESLYSNFLRYPYILILPLRKKTRPCRWSNFTTGPWDCSRRKWLCNWWRTLRRIPLRSCCIPPGSCQSPSSESSPILLSPVVSILLTHWPAAKAQARLTSLGHASRWAWAPSYWQTLGCLNQDQFVGLMP